MHITKTTHSDMRYVVANLSSDFMSELKEGDFSVEEVRTSIKNCIKRNCSLTLWNNDKIIAILGHPIVDDVICTAFPSTPDFVKVDTVRFGKKLMRSIQANNGNLPIDSRSYTFDPKVERWYKMIGYRLLTTEASHKVFRLDPL